MSEYDRKRCTEYHSRKCQELGAALDLALNDYRAWKAEQRALVRRAAAVKAAATRAANKAAGK